MSIETETNAALLTVEEYAIKLVADGAESVAEDDMNEDDEIADGEDHKAACDLAIEIAHAIKDNPVAALALVERQEPVAAVLRAAFAVIEVRLGKCPEFDDCAAADNGDPEHEHTNVEDRLRAWAGAPDPTAEVTR